MMVAYRSLISLYDFLLIGRMVSLRDHPWVLHYRLRRGRNMKNQTLNYQEILLNYVGLL